MTFARGRVLLGILVFHYIKVPLCALNSEGVQCPLYSEDLQCALISEGVQFALYSEDVQCALYTEDVTNGPNERGGGSSWRLIGLI